MNEKIDTKVHENQIGTLDFVLTPDVEDVIHQHNIEVFYETFFHPLAKALGLEAYNNSVVQDWGRLHSLFRMAAPTVQRIAILDHRAERQNAAARVARERAEARATTS